MKSYVNKLIVFSVVAMSILFAETKVEKQIWKKDLAVEANFIEGKIVYNKINTDRTSPSHGSVQLSTDSRSSIDGYLQLSYDSWAHESAHYLAVLVDNDGDGVATDLAYAPGFSGWVWGTADDDNLTYTKFQK